MSDRARGAYTRTENSWRKDNRKELAQPRIGISLFDTPSTLPPSESAANFEAVVAKKRIELIGLCSGSEHYYQKGIIETYMKTRGKQKVEDLDATEVIELHTKVTAKRRPR